MKTYIPYFKKIKVEELKNDTVIAWVDEKGNPRPDFRDIGGFRVKEVPDKKK